MKEIIIEGISINELKASQDKIKKGATALLSDNLDLAKKLTNQLLESNDKDEMIKLTQEAYEALSTADTLSKVADIPYFLPFDYEYGDDKVLSYILESSDNELIQELWDDGIYQLFSLFEDMESNSRDWNSSNCW